VCVWVCVCPGLSFLITAGKYVDVVARNFGTAIYAKFHTLPHWRPKQPYLYLFCSLIFCLFFMLISYLQDVGKFGDLALATITLANVILKTEEIYLLNHIKLYLKNNPTAAAAAEAATTTTGGGTGTGSGSLLQWQDEAPSTSSAAAAARAATSSRVSSSRSPISEINYFAKVLSEKLLGCLDALLGCDSVSGSSSASIAGHAYCQLAARFVNSLHNVCCRSRHKDALQSVFRLVLAESEFLCKYYNLLLMSAEGGGEALEPVLLACLQLLLSMRMLDLMVLLAQASELPLKWSLQRAMLDEVCRATVVSMERVRERGLTH